MFSAETAGIALGLSLALGVFSFKTSVGEYWFCSRKIPMRKKICFLLLTWSCYAVLFAGSFFLLDRIDLFRLAGNSSGFLRAGIPLHLILCSGMMFWGIRLLSRREERDITSNGWLLMTVPCPVCASSVFLVCAFAKMLFPESAGILAWGIPLFFLLSSVFFLAVLSAAEKLMKIPPLVLTGRLMILTALYFFLILLAAPQFESAGRLYAAARSAGGAGIPSPGSFSVLIPAVLAGFAGFFFHFHPRKGV